MPTPADLQQREELWHQLLQAETPEEQAVWEGLLAVWDVIHFLRHQPIEDDPCNSQAKTTSP